jgi:Tfp pilus assembly protein PilN
MTDHQRINLLPPELAQRRRQRQLLSMIVAAGLVLIAILALVYVIQEFRLHGVRGDLAAQRDKNASLQAEVGRLQEFDTLERTLKQKQTLLATLTQNEVRWSVLLADVSLVIPSDVWLTTFTGTVNLNPQPAAAGSAAQPLGSITLNGVTFSHVDVAKWLTRLGSVDAFSFPYLSLSSKSTIGTTPVVDFNSSVQLSQEAFRRNQRGAGRAT